MMAKRRKDDNPYDICTWRAVEACKGCSIAGNLKCRFDFSDLLHFLLIFLVFLLPAYFGMVTGGYGWYILGHVGFMVVFFGAWEIRILCSHCPYYARRGATLHCIANHGMPKLWRYHPEPMSRAEKIQLLVGFTFLGGYPLPFLLLGRQWIMGVIAALGVLTFFWTLSKYTCSQCVNFSCPLNTVPKNVVDAYLVRNPVMRRAWEASGWVVTEASPGD